ncbi:MAG: hypothetical protein ACR2J8_09515 [Thermomicrobiales bacterium]
MILHSFTNTESNTTAFVNKHSLGFSVTLRDNDCGEFVPCAIIYPNEMAAIAKAKQIVKEAS